MTSWFEIPKERLRLRTFWLHMLGACLNMLGTWLLGWTPTADTLLWAPYCPFQVPVGRVVLRFLLQETWVSPAPHPCRMNPEGRSPSHCCWSTCQWPPGGAGVIVLASETWTKVCRASWQRASGSWSEHKGVGTSSTVWHSPMWKEFLKRPVWLASIRLDSLTVKKTGFQMGCWRISPAWPCAGYLVLCKVPSLVWLLPLLHEVGNVGYSKNNLVNMYFKSPHVKIRIIRGLSSRTWIKWGWHQLKHV